LRGGVLFTAVEDEVFKLYERLSKTTDKIAVLNVRFAPSLLPTQKPDSPTVKPLLRVWQKLAWSFYTLISIYT